MKRYLRSFEAGLRQLLEGRLGRLFGARTQPVDLARRLADHMEDQRVVGAGRSYVPNNFRVYMAPETLSRFASFEAGLEDELAAFLGSRAQEAGLHFVGRVRVTLLADPELGGDRLRMESDLVDRRGVVLGESGQQTQAIALPESGRPTPARHELIVGQRRIPLDPKQPVGIGRALDNSIILESPSVSRHHARLGWRADHWAIEDLQSSHGSFVNGRRIASSVLRSGDRIQLGDCLLQLAEIDQDAPRSAGGPESSAPGRARGDLPQ
jgi:hypothetical protein